MMYTPNKHSHFDSLIQCRNLLQSSKTHASDFMAQRDPLGMMLGHKGDTSVEKFMRDRIQVCVVSMEKSPAVLQTPFFKFLDSMKVSKSVLQDPCVPTILQDARSITTVTQIEWKFVFSQQHYKEAMCNARLDFCCNSNIAFTWYSSVLQSCQRSHRFDDRG